MKTYRTVLCGSFPVLLWVQLFVATRSAVAADALEKIAPFIEPRTIAAARLELSELDFERLLGVLFSPEESAASDAEETVRVAAALDPFRRELMASGAERLWLTLNLADLPAGPALLLPSENPEATAQLFRDLPPRGRDALGRDRQIRVIDGVVIIAPPTVIERLAARPAASRPELAQVLESISDYPIALAVTPTEDMRRVMREMLPDLPPEWGGVSGPALAGALGRVAVGLDLSSPTHALVRLEGGSEEDAAAAFPAIRKVVEHLGLPGSSDEIQQEGNAISYRMDDAAVRAVAHSLVGPIRHSRAEAHRMQSWNNLKQLGLAMHNYHDVHKHFPPSGKENGGAAAGLSWRVHLLPFLEEGTLYEQFKLDEPWDSPHNRQLIDKMPAVYRSPLAPGLPPGKTVYQLPRMEGSIYGATDGEEPPRIRDVTDGLSNTILLFESNPAAAVTWTQPDDLRIDPQNVWEQLSAGGRDFVSILIGDGAVRALPIDTEPETVRAMITRAGGERHELP